jgi:hypothetical protein
MTAIQDTELAGIRQGVPGTFCNRPAVRQPLRVKGGGSGVARQPSGFPPIADILTSCCEPPLRARNGPLRRSKTLFDHLVGAAEQRQREGDAERLGGLEVDEQSCRPPTTRWPGGHWKEKAPAPSSKWEWCWGH